MTSPGVPPELLSGISPEKKLVLHSEVLEKKNIIVLPSEIHPEIYLKIVYKVFF